MALALYRRHRKECKGGHAHNTRTSEYDERKKGWRRCECPIFVSGTLDEKFKRENTGQWEWDVTRPVCASWEAVGTWTGPQPKAPEPIQVAQEDLHGRDRKSRCDKHAEEVSAALRQGA